MIPPEVLAGEVGPVEFCTFTAWIAVAWVYSRNPRMNGWNDDYDDLHLIVATFWPWLKDMSYGAEFVFSRQDLELAAVKAIVRGRGPPKAIYGCRAGLALYFF